jgi:hypothetical protein
LFRPFLTGVLLFTFAIGTTGCATLLTGGDQRPIRVYTEPPGAEVYVADENYGVTPIEINVDRDLVQEIRIVKAGFEPFEGQIKPGFNGWVLGNILIGGIIGLVVDLISGAHEVPKPETIKLKLLPTGSAYPPQNQAFKSAEIEDMRIEKDGDEDDGVGSTSS